LLSLDCEFFLICNFQIPKKKVIPNFSHIIEYFKNLKRLSALPTYLKLLPVLEVSFSQNYNFKKSHIFVVLHRHNISEVIERASHQFDHVTLLNYKCWNLMICLWFFLWSQFFSGIFLVNFNVICGGAVASWLVRLIDSESWALSRDKCVVF